MLSLLGGVAVVSMVFALYQASAEMHAMLKAESRAARRMVLAESQERSCARQVLQDGSPAELQALVGQFQNHEQMAGVTIYSAAGQPLAMTPGLAARLDDAAVTPPAVARALREGGVRGAFFRGRSERMHILALPLQTDGRRLGAIAVFHNVGFIAAPVWRHALTSMAQTLLIVGMTLLIIAMESGKAPSPYGAMAARSAHRQRLPFRPAAPRRDLYSARPRNDQHGDLSACCSRRGRRGGPSTRRRLVPMDSPRGCASPMQ